MPRSLAEIETAIRAGWSRWTSDPVDQERWSHENPSWGQCASTALLIQDLVGGELLLADVHAADGAPAGVHFWNRLVNGSELDLTREQFRSGERVGEPRTVPRPVDVTRGRLPGQYHLLASRVTRLLADGDPDSVRWPVTVKVVCLDSDGRALLCRNHRGEWELPGGRPETGELFTETIARETEEETGLTVRAERLLGAEPLEPVPGQWVDVVAYESSPDGHVRRAPKASGEHTAVAFLDVAELADAELPALYRRFITATLNTSGGVGLKSRPTVRVGNRHRLGLGFRRCRCGGLKRPAEGDVQSAFR